MSRHNPSENSGRDGESGSRHEVTARTLEDFYAVGLAPQECDGDPYTFLVGPEDLRSNWFPCAFHEGFFAGFDEARRLADLASHRGD